jgi:hypothetical protein
VVALSLFAVGKAAMEKKASTCLKIKILKAGYDLFLCFISEKHHLYFLIFVLLIRFIFQCQVEITWSLGQVL